MLRNADADDAVETARACVEAGVRAVELTFSTPDVLTAVRVLAAEGVCVGVGTVRTPAQVDAAAQAGAAFVVSFARPPGFLTAAAAAGVLAVPGVLTPSEVAAALDEGAEAVKLFPARLVPPAYLADLRAVVGPVPVLVTGGIPPTLEAVDEWCRAGAACVGIGSQLGTAGKDGREAVRARAAALVR